MQEINASMLSKMFLYGAKNLESKKEWINELNVFPVPDGDTGTNMTMTIMSAAKEVNALGEDATMAQLCKAISGGSLRGARGNSGVILSQLFRGFCKSVAEEELLSVHVLAVGFEKAVETAYKAVMKPKEGTILTVAKGIAEMAKELDQRGVTDIDEFCREVIKKGEEVLAYTPELLPVLKQAGVVDSGGQGLIVVLQGAYDGFLGKEIDLNFEVPASAGRVTNTEAAAEEEEIKFGYCTEFIILLDKKFTSKMESDFKSFLESIGDSIVCVADDDIVKTHVHTNDPGLAIQKALTYGALSNMKIDNMRLEHQEKLFKMNEGKATEIPTQVSACGDAPVGGGSAEDALAPQGEPKDMAFIAVSSGSGLSEIFRSLGVDYLIEGGQTMNPSTADFLDAIEKINAKTVFILPNNKNIILAANQAAELMTDKEVLVIPTKTIPQGITAAISFAPDCSAEDNEAAMLDAITNVKTGEVTYAIRDTMIDDVEIKVNDYMGIADGKIFAADKDIDFVMKTMIENMVDDASELISIYYGEGVDEETASKLSDEIAGKYSALDVELQFGGQPVYSYIVSVE